MRCIVALVATSLACIACAIAAPDEELLGKGRGYSIGTRATWYFDESVRVGSFSNLDTLLPHHVLKKSPAPMELKRAAAGPTLTYRYNGKTYTLDDYLDHQRATGLLVIKDGEILAERYQYERNAAHRFVSHSMAKSLVSIAVGFALAEKRIKSLDDKASDYVAKLKATSTAKRRCGICSGCRPASSSPKTMTATTICPNSRARSRPRARWLDSAVRRA